MKKALGYLAAWWLDPARARAQPGRPSVLNLPITDNCNARCVMCDVWKTPSVGELDATELRRILAEPFFSQLRHVGISGGEPTLRGDLVEVVEAILAALPALRTLSITSHGFHPLRWRRFLGPIAEACARRRVGFTLNLSVDGVGPLHDEVRGVPGGFGRVLETRALARSAGVPVQLQATVSAPNVFHVGRLLRYAREQGDAIQFRVATIIERLDNRSSMGGVALEPGEASFFADFLAAPGLLAATGNPARRLFYADLARRLSAAGPRRAPCYFQSEGVLLGPKGDLHHCSIGPEALGNLRQASAQELYFSAAGLAVRERLLGQTCPGCVHDQAGAWAPQQLAVEVLRRTGLGQASATGRRVWRFGWSLVPLAARAIAARLRPRPVPPTGRPRGALLIGAYGGEHVGDAAILGGVVQRLVQRLDIERAVVASTRPDRTAHWLSGLELPIPVEVAPAGPALRTRLRELGLLVWAGGPVMDLPELLASHLALAQAARAAGVPFVLEGVGIGPFRSSVSRALARALLASAFEVRVRTRAALASPLLPAGRALLGEDPAFDYLASRTQLDRVTPREQDAIDRAFAGAQGPVLVLNLRPLWSKYVQGADAGAVETALLTALADALRALRLADGRRPRVVFLPLNADQYGFSDLDVAADLEARVGAAVDLRTCEHELGVDAAIAVLRRATAVVSMRFHGCIFALSQGLPTLGLDYSVGERGKVGELFADRGRTVDVVAIADAPASDLAARFAALLAAPAHAGQAQP